MHPNVYWAQTEKEIYLKVAICDLLGSPDICIEEEEIEFLALAQSSSSSSGGAQRYDFVIEFFLPIDASSSSYVIREREIKINLPKKEPDWWPRLLHEPKKLNWLKIDFDNGRKRRITRSLLKMKGLKKRIPSLQRTFFDQ
ncbi:Very-long-chain (3R)-3-hydroxyacyl-CoA dehydratase, partial [Caligus rogercresseyi]